MSIHYTEQQYRQIVPAALEFLKHCQSRGLAIQNKIIGRPGANRIAITYCPANRTYHFYDLGLSCQIHFKRLEPIDVRKATYEHVTINGYEYEWTLSNNAYKEGISTVILIYEPQVELINRNTIWDLTELRKVMSKEFQYPLIRFK